MFTEKEKPLGQKNQKKEQEKKIFNREIIEGTIENLIISSTFVNEGNNGVIKKINIEDIPEEILKMIKYYHPDFSLNPSFAVKMLKIYNKGEAKKEYQLQKKAYEALAQEDDGKVAKIPKPILYERISIKSQEAKDVLTRDGIKDSKQVEIILMDLIEGEDLAEHLYREVIKLHPDLETFHKEADEIPFIDLQNLVSKALKFSIVGKYDGLDDKKIKEEMVNNENLKILLKFLKSKKEFKIDKKIVERVERTIQILHKNHIYHRDLHERNIMITKNESNNINDVFIVDFGSAKEFAPGDKESEIYTTEGKAFIKDETLINRYKGFILPLKARINNENQTEINETQLYLRSLSKNKKWNEFQAKIKAAGNLEEASKIINRITFEASGGVINDTYVNTVAAAILELGLINKNLAIQYINSVLNDKNANIRLQNKLAKILSQL